MASSSSTSQGANLLLSLPPELRNVIYALVINTDFYELDPTISIKTFPRPRYSIFGIQRGIKAQGGTPAIAKTCREIRTEALDVYYGGNTFSLVGDDSTRAKKTDARANRNAAHEWMQLIGDDAKYLRQVRMLVWTMHGNVLLLDHLLLSVVSDSSGKAPLVGVSPDSRAAVAAHSFRAMRARHLQTIMQDYLVETNEMGRVWHATAERAMYPFSGNIENFDFDISEQGIADVAAKYPLTKKPKASAKKSAPSYAYPASFSKRNASPAAEVPGYNSDCMEIEAPTKKPQDARKKAPKATPDTQAADECSVSTTKIAPATRAVPGLQGEVPKDSEVGEPAQSTAAGMVYGAAPLPTATHEAEVEIDMNPKPATRSSTRKRQARKL